LVSYLGNQVDTSVLPSVFASFKFFAIIHAALMPGTPLPVLAMDSIEDHGIAGALLQAKQLSVIIIYKGTGLFQVLLSQAEFF
jgi:hypothetical protein